MDATTAMDETASIMDGLLSAVTPEHREMRTPCEKWNVHELIGHVCQGGHQMAVGLLGEEPPDDDVDILADGPAKGWADAQDHLRAAVKPEILGSLHQMPFGLIPGEAALSVIVSDHLVHAWDLAQATEQDFECSDEIAIWALHVWEGLAPPEGRTGEPFADVVPVPENAPPLNRMIAYTGRQP